MFSKLSLFGQKNRDQSSVGSSRGSRTILARFGWAFLALLVVCAIFAPWLAPYSIHELDVTQQLQGPSPYHWLGTDENGIDLLSALLYGSRVALIVGFTVVSICSCLGTIIGMIAGFFGGWVDELLMRLTEILMSFPGILLAILIIFVTQDPSLIAVIGALSVTGWASYARLVRGQVLSEREEEYVLAAQVMGASSQRIMFRHLLPNIAGPIVVQATFGIAGAILAEASLSFLGLGPQNLPSWGALLDQGASYFLLAPYLAFFPGLAIMLTVLAINFVGDDLRARLDPHSDY